jgi:hypothetical protein
VLWNILSDFGRVAAVTADSLSHINLIDLMFKVPARNSVPRTARPARNPPSSDRYDVISDWIPSSGPPPREEGLFLILLLRNSHGIPLQIVLIHW